MKIFDDREEADGIEKYSSSSFKYPMDLYMIILME